MPTLKEMIAAENAKRANKKPGLLSALQNAGQVFNEGLLNPNQYNAPAANRFKDSAFGLLGALPGVGDAASAAESADLFNRGENFAGGLAALGALPLVPSFAGMVKQGGNAIDALRPVDASGLLGKVDNSGMNVDVVQKAYLDSLAQDPHAVYGMRVIPHGYEVKAGDALDHSNVWVDGEMTGDVLPGVSTIEIEKGDVAKALERLKKAGYSGKQIALIKGDSGGYGEDTYERLIKNPEVVDAFIRK